MRLLRASCCRARFLVRPYPEVAPPAIARRKQVATTFLRGVGVLTDERAWTIGPAPTSDAYGHLFNPYDLAFSRIVDGVTVSGPAWQFRFDAGGRIDSLDASLGTIAPVGVFPIDTTPTVFARLAAGHAYNAGSPFFEAIGHGTVPSAWVPRVASVQHVQRGLADWQSSEGTTYVPPTDRFTVLQTETFELEVLALPDTAFARPTTTTMVAY